MYLKVTDGTLAIVALVALGFVVVMILLILVVVVVLSILKFKSKAWQVKKTYPKDFVTLRPGLTVECTHICTLLRALQVKGPNKLHALRANGLIRPPKNLG